MSDLDVRDRVLTAVLSSQSSLLAYAYSLLGDFAAAEDVVQNVFIIVARKYNDFEEGTSIVAWCRPMVRLEVLTYLRKRKREWSLEDLILRDAMDTAFEAHSTDDTSCRLDHLRDCLGKLSQRGQALIRLRYEENARYQEIANALEMKIEAVRKSLFRAKRQLRECVSVRMNEETT